MRIATQTDIPKSVRFMLQAERTAGAGEPRPWIYPPFALCTAFSRNAASAGRPPPPGDPASSASAALRRVETAISVPLVRREGQALVPTLEAEARLPRFTDIANAAAALAALGARTQGAPLSISLAALSRFVSAARTGSINSAAKSLGLGQPQLTRQLTHLEEAIGCTLLERSATGIRCTPAGLDALALAERIGAAWEALSPPRANVSVVAPPPGGSARSSPLDMKARSPPCSRGLPSNGGQRGRASRSSSPRRRRTTSVVSGLKNRPTDLILLDTDHYPAEFEGSLIGRSQLALAGPAG